MRILFQLSAVVLLIATMSYTAEAKSSGHKKASQYLAVGKKKSDTGKKRNVASVKKKGHKKLKKKHSKRHR